MKPVDIEARINRWPSKGIEIPETDRQELCKIRKWVYGVCRKQEIAPEDVWVSAFPQQTADGKKSSVTLICVTKYLPESPIITINKAPAEVTLEDILGCYKLVNWCECGS